MSTIVIYGAYAEGYVFKGSTQLKAVEPCSSVYLQSKKKCVNWRI